MVGVAASLSRLSSWLTVAPSPGRVQAVHNHGTPSRTLRAPGAVDPRVLQREVTEPGLLATVVAVSPAVWTSYEAMMLGPRDAFDNVADFAAHDAIGHIVKGVPRPQHHRLV